MCRPPRFAGDPTLPPAHLPHLPRSSHGSLTSHIQPPASRSPTVQLPPSPLTVVWRLTEACDLACWFCEYNRQLHRPRRAARPADVLAFGQVLAAHATATGRPVQVSWLGGEPLVWPALIEVGRVFSQDYGLPLSLTTNGQRLSAPGLIEHLAELYSALTISVDGLADFHDPARSAPGLFERLGAAVAQLCERKARQGRGPLLRANTVLMRSNLQALEPLCETLATWGIQEVTFNALGGHPPGPDYERQRLLPADVAWLRSALPGIRQRLAGRGLVIRGSDRYLDRLGPSAAGVAWPVADCSPGTAFLFVDEQGRAAPCSFTTVGYGLPISELHTAADLQQLPVRLAARRRQSLLPPCHDCPRTQVFGKFDLSEAP